MVFRFWGPNVKAAEPASGENSHVHPPGVIALIEDAVASKHGVILSVHDQLYVSGLKQPADALVVSRRVQFGLQGFRGKHPAGPVAVSIVIDAAGGTAKPDSGAQTGGDSTPLPSANQASANQGPEPPHDLVTLLKLSKPAQILLTHDLCQQVAEVKGLPLKSFPARFGVYEYLWTAEDKLEVLQSEPQLTLAAVPAAPAKEKTSPAAAATAKAVGLPESHGNIVQPGRPAFQSSRVLILAAAALVVLVAAILVGVHLAHGSGSAPVKQETSVASPAASQPANPPANPPAVTPPVQTQVPEPAVKTNEKPKAPPPQAKPPRTQAAVKQVGAEEKPAPAPSANCTLGANAGRFVSLGEQARGRGDYANAIRIFREVIDCDPGNAAAHDGLEKATRGQEQHH
jgi:hypothetical protein